MGKKASEARRKTRRGMRPTPLNKVERDFLSKNATYEGVAYHKRSPGDFGLTPPAAPRPDKTLCDEAGVEKQAEADDLLAQAIDGGFVSETIGAPNFPKHLWVVTDEGSVFEATYGGSKPGAYHGYPILKSDPFGDQVRRVWHKRYA